MTQPFTSWAVGSDTERILDTEDARAGIGALWTPSGAATARGGWRPSPDGTQGLVTATSPTADTSVHVAPFQYVLPSARGAGTPYILSLPATFDIDVLTDTPADPANGRHDLIVAQQNDKAFGDADSLLDIRQVVGVPSGAPADPDPTAGGTLSTDYVLLARVRVDAGVTDIDAGHIDDLRSTDLAVALGGILPVADQTERGGIANPYHGMSIYRRDLDWVEVYDGTAWRVQGVAIVVDTGDRDGFITDPRPGQLALTTTDGILYLFNDGAWQRYYGYGPWIALPLNNGWTDFDAVVLPAAYRLAPGNRVEVIGKITGGTNANGTTVATLPAGFRVSSEVFMVAGSNTGHAVNLTCGTDGTIKISNVNTAPTTIAINGSIPLGTS